MVIKFHGQLRRPWNQRIGITIGKPDMYVVASGINPQRSTPEDLPPEQIIDVRKGSNGYRINLLSSFDDLWMYTPLAYNGLDIGLNLNMNMKNSLLLLDQRG
ncbi:hypothetical protein DEO72_LG3g1811 [Vigna unguiculata]|uniref:Uncharacterized protein n=1 Tax=Vigna unguiculata TaxID=3917 RepID=A0A4D6LFD9_VIGUN|nr:hypothetical protein DEO72_LG3g1811 [Vigna unguiculata]